MDKGQTMRYSKDELELIQRIFGNEQILFVLRNHFWQFNVSKADRKLIEFSEEGLKLLRKIILPENNPDVPIFQQVSMYQSLYKVRDLNPAAGALFIRANDLLIQYINQQFESLVNPDVEETMILEELPKRDMGYDQDEMRYVNVLAYHNIGAYIEGRMQEIQILSNPPKEEPEEEKAKRLAKNSAK